MSGRALTLDYASPEQVNGQTLGTASDVYALGVVLYELLTGNKPYSPKGPTRRDLELAIVEQEPTKPSDRLMLTGTSEAGKTARRIRGDLDTVVLKALKKDLGNATPRRKRLRMICSGISRLSRSQRSQIAIGIGARNLCGGIG